MREHERDAEQLDLVATGPSSPHVSIRHTRTVLLELIDRAQRELILVSYAAYKVPALVEALERARQRSVVVRLILESTADSAGALTHDGAEAFTSLRESVEIYVWPIAKRQPKQTCTWQGRVNRHPPTLRMCSCSHKKLLDKEADATGERVVGSSASLT